MRAFLAVARNEITQILRDKVYLLLLTVGGVSTLVTLAYTLSTDIEDVRTLVVNLDDVRPVDQATVEIEADRHDDLLHDWLAEQLAQQLVDMHPDDQRAVFELMKRIRVREEARGTGGLEDVPTAPA